MPVQPPLLLVTRPAREALAWTRTLQGLGLRAEALPLIAIGPGPDPQGLAKRQAALSGDAAVMFVSANAVRGFFDAAGPELSWPAGTRAWSTGPGTHAALLEVGVPATQIDSPDPQAGRFDSESLWACVQAPLIAQVRAQGSGAPVRVLIVRGADADGEAAGRDWLALRLREAGVRVDQVPAYRRVLPEWTSSERALLDEACRAPAAWLFSSSEAVANLTRLAPVAGWQGGLALCTHGRIAQAARSAGFSQVAEVAPRPESVAAFLQSAS